MPRTTRDQRRYFEHPKPLSRSIVWELQRRFYDSHGAKAWQDSHVPFEISSNAYLARRYAEILLGLMRDLRSGRMGKRWRSTPLTIVELGAGAGRLGFLVTRELKRLVESLGWGPGSFRYVLTDFTPSNLHTYETNPRLIELADSGVLDMALFDAEQPTTLRLRKSGTLLGPGGQPRPIALIANYLFDTVHHDAFKVEEGALYETRVGLALKPRHKAMPRRRDPDALDHLELTEHHRKIELPYYRDPALDGVLAEYHAEFDECEMLFPIGAFNCMAWFRKVARAPMLVICGDKGYRSDAELKAGVGAYLSLHAKGSFSTMVNLNAIGRVVTRQSGLALHAPLNDLTFTVSTFLTGAKPEAAIETRFAYDAALAGVGPRHYQTTLDELKRRWSDPSVPSALAMIRLADFDQDVFMRFAPVLLRKGQRQQSDTRADLIAALEAVWQRFYPLSAKEPVVFTIGQIQYALRRFAEARRFFEHALALEEDDAKTRYNIALCSQALGELERALIEYDGAIARDGAYAPARIARAKLARHLDQRARR